MLLTVLAAAAPAAARAQGLGPCPGPTLASPAGAPAETPWTDASLDPDRRANLLLAAMTLEEKIDLATGERCLNYGYYNAPIARLGIPALTMADGPAGIRIPYRRVNDGRATQLPSPVALAATWDLDLARAQGDILGAEAFATGHNIVLGPTLDMPRGALAGRTFEGLGEDPLLASRLAGPIIEGIQAHPVMADAKHFVAYTQETERFTFDAQVDERTLREIYLRPFEAAVRAGVASVMCGFNRVNGVHACENPALLNDILKGDMGFDGFVLSDWSSIHSTAGAAMAGLDQELAFERYFGSKLLDAVRRGEVPVEAVDDKARRIARAMFRLGLFDHPVDEAPLPEREHGARSREIAEQAIVLLKNDGGLLPLSTDALRSIAVIGADAANVHAQGAGAARVEPTYGVSVVEGIRQRAGAGVRVEHAAGGDPLTAAHLVPGPPAVPSAVLAPPGDPSRRGLRAEYWMNARFEGPPDLVQLEGHVARSMGFFNYPSTSASSVPQLPARYSLHRFSARYTGTVTPPTTGDHVLTLTSLGQGWLYVDDQLVIDHSEVHGLDSRSATVRLEAGRAHEIRIDYAADHPDIGKKTDLGGDVKLSWTVPPGTVAPAVAEAVALASRSDVAIVVARDYSTEERDRPDLSLPGEQDELIAAVAAVNPRTVVVLTTGQSVSMPWLDRVPAVLEAWYPGQEQGNAIARVLFGDVNPSGKLPLTFPRTAEQTPAGAGASTRDAQGPIVGHAEGILVGYRWYDATGNEPLFPFGFGLSYTSFAYRDLEVTGTAPHSVAFTITNDGPRAGAEIAQVYVGRCSGDATSPPKQLAGFAKVPLDAGASARVTIPVAPEAHSHWSIESGEWVDPACEREVLVASSSRDVRLTAVVGSPVVAAAPEEQPGGSPSAPRERRGCAAGGGSSANSALALVVAAALGRRGRRA